MQVKQSVVSLTAGAVMLAWSSGGMAQQETPDLSSPAQAYVQQAGVLVLAANETDTVAKNNSNAVSVKKVNTEFEPELWSGSNAHMYLGLATIVAAGLTAVTAPEDGCEHGCTGPQPPRELNGAHAKFAKATVGLAAATIATGLLVHWDDFYLEDGWSDPDNLHVLLGMTGAALMAYAVNKSAASTVPVSHAGLAELGALGMVVAIKLTW